MKWAKNTWFHGIYLLRQRLVRFLREISCEVSKLKSTDFTEFFSNLLKGGTKNSQKSRNFTEIHEQFTLISRKISWIHETILQNQMKLEAIWFHEKISNFERNFRQIAMYVHTTQCGKEL